MRPRTTEVGTASRLSPLRFAGKLRHSVARVSNRKHTVSLDAVERMARAPLGHSRTRQSRTQRLCRAEFWMPVWRHATTLVELKGLLSEGRLQRHDGVPAKHSIQAVEAIATLGISRGIDAYQRVALFERRGEGYYVCSSRRIGNHRARHEPARRNHPQLGDRHPVAAMMIVFPACTFRSTAPESLCSSRSVMILLMTQNVASAALGNKRRSAGVGARRLLRRETTCDNSRASPEAVFPGAERGLGAPESLKGIEASKRPELVEVRVRGNEPGDPSIGRTARGGSNP